MLTINDETNSIKHYFEDGRGLRTELAVENPYEFGVGRALENHATLRERI